MRISTRIVDLFRVSGAVEEIFLRDRTFLVEDFPGQLNAFFYAPGPAVDTAIDPDFCPAGSLCLLGFAGIDFDDGEGFREPGVYAVVYEYAYTFGAPPPPGIVDQIRYRFEFTPSNVVPLPAAAPLLAAGLAGLVALRRRHHG